MKLNLTIPESDKKIVDEIFGVIKSTKTAYISWHARPDGDAIGGGLALYRVLTEYGIDVRVISPTAPSSTYGFLRDFNSIEIAPPLEKRDSVFILDCSDTKRLEKVKEVLNKVDTVVNIDHHQLNHEFGDINYIRAENSSVCELVLNIAIKLEIDFDEDLASCLYIGVLTDTNRFQEQNTTKRSHLIAAELIENHLSPVKISSLIYGNHELKTLRLISMAIDNLKIALDNKVGYITIKPEVYKLTNTTHEDLEGIINYARNIKGVEVGILFRIIPGLDGIKVSFRSKGKVDVAEIATSFGGGGHHNAAGCLIPGSFEEVTEKVLSEVRKRIN